MPSKRLILSSVLFAACCIVAALWWSRHRTSDGLKPVGGSPAGQGAYVDERQCAECHSERADSHQHHGHADTFRLSGETDFARKLAGQIFVDPERGFSYNYHFDDEDGLSVSLPNQLGEDRFPLTYALGSGHNAVTLLSLIPDRRGDTVGIEHRVSLYRGDDGWQLDLTPGHRGAVAGQEIEQFGKMIRGDTLTGCIGCHTVTAEISSHKLVELRPNVGCQSCHGPGRRHVTAMQNGEENDYSRLTEQSAAQEIELCGRCHRLPTSESVAHLSPNIIQNIRFQPAGLLQSRCFAASKDLRCSTCHDPHQPVSRSREHYVNRCLDCHGDAKSTTCPVSPADNCIGCHMPAIDVHRGIMFHDHWIRVRRDQPGKPPE